MRPAELKIFAMRPFAAEVADSWCGWKASLPLWEETSRALGTQSQALQVIVQPSKDPDTLRVLLCERRWTETLERLTLGFHL